MERPGFLLLCSTLDYMHHFFNLYVLKKYNRYIFELTLESKFSSFKYSIPLILKISLSYSYQAQYPLKRKKKKKLYSVKDGFMVLILKLHPFSMKRLNADTKVHLAHVQAKLESVAGEKIFFLYLFDKKIIVIIKLLPGV